MKILTIGDIVGECGIKKLRGILKNFIQERNIDFVIANGENSADGMGITESIFKELLALGKCYNNGKPYLGKKRYF